MLDKIANFFKQDAAVTFGQYIILCFLMTGAGVFFTLIFHT
jgi:hypothetical protein